MRFRDHYWKREATIADADTIIVDLSVVDPISYISIEYEATNGATSCIDHELHDDISKIELVDGSDVLWSMSAVEALALNFLELKKMPHQKLTEAAAGVQEEVFYIHFGRFQNDPRFYLEPSRYANLQLRITHSLTISATVGFATGTGKVTIMGRLIEEGALPYEGFLMAKEKYSFTSGTSGDEQIDLPKDHPYRLMLVKALVTLKRPDEVLSRLKVSCDADKYIPFDLHTEDIMDENEKQFGQATQDKALLSADDGTALMDIYDIRRAHVRTTEDDHIATIEGLLGERVSVGLYDLTTPATPALQTATKAVPVVVQGICVSGVVAISFGDMQNPESWFDAPAFGDIDLFATQAAAGACAVILQQLRV